MFNIDTQTIFFNNFEPYIINKIKSQIDNEIIKKYIFNVALEKYNQNTNRFIELLLCYFDFETLKTMLVLNKKIKSIIEKYYEYILNKNKKTKIIITSKCYNYLFLKNDKLLQYIKKMKNMGFSIVYDINFIRAMSEKYNNFVNYDPDNIKVSSIYELNRPNYICSESKWEYKLTKNDKENIIKMKVQYNFKELINHKMEILDIHKYIHLGYHQVKNGQYTRDIITEYYDEILNLIPWKELNLDEIIMSEDYIPKYFYPNNIKKFNYVNDNTNNLKCDKCIVSKIKHKEMQGIKNTWNHIKPIKIGFETNK